jgi:hypothetical protein
MSEAANDVLEMLQDDMVSRGWVVYCCNKATHSNFGEKELLEELLTSGKVEVGRTRQTRPDYLDFVAWRGSVAERIARALDAVAAVKGADKEFAYWLALRENVDRFEEKPETL